MARRHPTSSGPSPSIPYSPRCSTSSIATPPRGGGPAYPSRWSQVPWWTLIQALLGADHEVAYDAQPVLSVDVLFDDRWGSHLEDRDAIDRWWFDDRPCDGAAEDAPQS